MEGDKKTKTMVYDESNEKITKTNVFFSSEFFFFLPPSSFNDGWPSI